MNILHTSVHFSLWVQILTGIFDLYVYQFKVSSDLYILKELLLMELIVQIVEGSFYVWLAYSFLQVKNITPIRYYDWFITTPTMLITYSVYLIYLKNKEENKVTTENLYGIIKENALIFSQILSLNAIMLMFGFLHELEHIPKYLSTFLGFIPFIIMFYLIYDNFAKYSERGMQLFWIFSTIWSLYGVAALFPYHLKNTSYNILDLFAKNFFGIYIAVVILLESRNL